MKEAMTLIEARDPHGLCVEGDDVYFIEVGEDRSCAAYRSDLRGGGRRRLFDVPLRSVLAVDRDHLWAVLTDATVDAPQPVVVLPRGEGAPSEVASIDRLARSAVATRGALFVATYDVGGDGALWRLDARGGARRTGVTDVASRHPALQVAGDHVYVTVRNGIERVRIDDAVVDWCFTPGDERSPDGEGMLVHE